MKRLLTTVGLGVGVTLLGAGTAFAGCPQPGDHFPESEGWVAVDDTVTVPAGYSCNVAVTVHIVGHERTTINGKEASTYPEDYVPKPGDRFVGVAPDEKITVTNTKNNRSVTKRIDGSFYDRVARNGKDLHSKGVGRNSFFGAGVRGILWTDGVQKFDVYNFMDETSTLDIYKVKGRSVELCKRVGARAVEGKNLPAPTS